MKLAVIATVAGKDLQEIFRDRLLFSLAFLMPVSMMLLLGFGLSLDVENLRSECSTTTAQQPAGSISTSLPAPGALTFSQN